MYSIEHWKGTVVANRNLQKVFNGICQSAVIGEPSKVSWDHIRTWPFRIVPKRIEAILLVRNVVSQKIDQENGFVSFRNNTVTCKHGLSFFLLKTWNAHLRLQLILHLQWVIELRRIWTLTAGLHSARYRIFTGEVKLYVILCVEMKAISVFPKQKKSAILTLRCTLQFWRRIKCNGFFAFEGYIFRNRVVDFTFNPAFVNY